MSSCLASDNIPYEKVGDEVRSLEDEIPFEIPDSWEWTRLSSANDMYTGNSINETEKRLKYTGLNSGRFYIGTKDVGFDHEINYDNGVRIPLENDNFRVAPSGSILLCIEGGSAGRKIAFTNQTVCFGNKLCCFVSFGLNPMFLYYYLQSPLFLSAFKENTTGIIGGVSVNTLKEMFLPIPPLAEQQRIVDEIERIIPFIIEYDKAETNLRTLNTSFPEALKKSILQMAVQGKLVPQDPNDEPAEVLLERIRGEKERLVKEGKIKKDKNESVIFRRDNSHYEKHGSEEVCIEENLPFEIPSSWVWVRWGTLSESIQYGYNAPAQEKGSVRMVRISDIQNNKVNWETVPYCDISDTDIDTYELKPNDILFARTGGTVGKSFLVQEVPFLSVYAGYLIRTRYSSELYPGYLKLFMECPFYWEQLKNGTTVTAQPNCNGQTLSKMLIPLPPKNEQQRIVKMVHSLQVRIDAITL